MSFTLDGFDLDAFVSATLAEDLGDGGDITSQAVIPADARFAGVMDSREAVVVAGLPIAEAFFRRLDPEVAIERLAEDGDAVAAGADLLRLTGSARALLTAERSALNTVQHLTAVAADLRPAGSRQLRGRLTVAPEEAVHVRRRGVPWLARVDDDPGATLTAELQRGGQAGGRAADDGDIAVPLHGAGCVMAAHGATLRWIPKSA